MDDNSSKVLEKCKFSLFFFLKFLPPKGLKNLLNWCMNVGLIPSASVCPDCSQNMSLCQEKENIHGYEWRCLKPHEKNHRDTKRSVVEGTCFSYSSLDMYATLRLMWFWLIKASLDRINDELYLNDQIIADCYTLCREIVVIDLISKSDKIGGKGVAVEVDVCKLGEMKYEKEKLPNGQWVFGGFESETKNYFIKIVERNSKEDFLKIISEWILPGSIVMSDCWEFYDCLSDKEFVQLSILNNLTFKASSVGEHNKAIDIAKSMLEGPLKNNNIDVLFDSYLGEYMWRKKYDNLDSSERFKIFLKAIIKNCHGTINSLKSQ